MNRRMIVLYLVVSFLIVITLAGCSSFSDQLQNAMDSYEKTVETTIPDDLCLTIYYMDPEILTLIPVTPEDLIRWDSTQRIFVAAEELSKHQELLKKLDSSILEPANMKTHIDARLYYVFERGDSTKLLEVVISDIHGNVFVNGVEVADHPVFYELIKPFLSEEDCSILGI